jgi:hypothetical protein
MLSRRGFVAAAAGFLVMGMRKGEPLPDPKTPITVYKSRTCGCCAEWVDHVDASGFRATVHDEEEMDRLKDRLGMPEAVRSCHTAVVDGYLIEGHVPASDIRQLLAKRPKVGGLAVPGMPPNSPGMAPAGAKVGGFDVLAFRLDGSTYRFATH